MSKKRRLGIIQSRGLGDIVIALPIARYYFSEGWDVYWPIDEQFMGSLVSSVPWVKWIPLTVDSGRYFYDTPLERLNNFKCDEIICLYQSLSSHPEFSLRPEFQITGFDQIKYHIAQVPFVHKWQLAECITRDAQREQALKDQLKITPGANYVLVHKEGSNYTAHVDPDWVPDGWGIIEITPLTDNIFDWIGVLEGAQAIIAVDSVIANIVDQMNLTQNIDCYFIPRSHIHLTPVLGGSWTVLDPDPEVLKRISIFRSS